jgi:hypothetical protein
LTNQRSNIESENKQNNYKTIKKLALTIAIVLGLGLTTFADPNEGGLFKRGIVPDEEYYNMGMNRDGNAPLLPNHGMPDNQDGNQGPVGTGIAVLAALGGAYLIGKRRKQE